MRPLRFIAGLSAICCVLLFASPARAADTEIQAAAGGQVINLDDSIPASEFPPIVLGWVSEAFSTEGGSVNSLQCLLTARDRGQVARGMTAQLEGEIVDEDGNTIRTLNRKTSTFSPAARFSWPFVDVSAEQDAVGVVVGGTLAGQRLLDVLKVDCFALHRARCRRNQETLCLVGNNRFKTQVDFGSGKPGQVVGSTPRSGLFSRSGSSGADVLIEIFNRCSVNDHYWVGVASVIGAAFDVVVEDTLSGETRAFSNPGPFQAVVDTSAFATCP